MGEGTSCLRGKKQQQWVRKFLPNCRLSQKVCLSVKFCKYKWEFIIIPLSPQKFRDTAEKQQSQPNIACFLLGFCILHVHSVVEKKKKKTLTRTLTQFFSFTYHKPDTSKGSFQNSMLLNNKRLNGKGKNDEILKRILWTYFLVSGAGWKYDTFSCFFCFFWMQNLIRSNGKPPVLFFAWKNEEVLPSSDKPAANTASMLQLLTSSLLFPN